MNSKPTENANKPEELNPLMEAFNPRPLEAAKPARFYWEEPCEEGSPDDCVQKTFEN